MEYNRCDAFLPGGRSGLSLGGSSTPQQGEGDFAVIGKLKQLRNQVSQTDVALHLTATFSLAQRRHSSEKNVIFSFHAVESVQKRQRLLGVFL